MSAGGLIYIAGNPDLYPLEYYDPDAGTYQGTIPSVLAQFAQESGYDLQYYQPGATDRRAELERTSRSMLSPAVRTGKRYPAQNRSLCSKQKSTAKRSHILLFSRIRLQRTLCRHCAPICPG